MKNKSEKKKTAQQRNLEELLAKAGVRVVDPKANPKAKTKPKVKKEPTPVASSTLKGDDTRPGARHKVTARSPKPIEARQPKKTIAPKAPSKAAAVVAEDLPVRIGWLLQCPPGLSKTMQRELNYVGAIARDQKVFDRLQRNHDLTFIPGAKDESAFVKSRIAEMVLKCPAYGRFKISKRQLQIMADAVKEVGARRLVVSVAGRHFNRQDLSRFLARELEERGAVIEDGIEDEVWMFCIDEDWYFGLPIKKARDADGREAREEERRGSLPPPVAAALAFASMVRNDDIVFDPTCGSGTLLSEVHAYAPSARLIGFDIDASAVKIAKANLKHVNETDLRVGDARSAKFENANVTLTIANLPFGKQFGSKTTNAELYTDLFAKSLELRDPDRPWRGIFLTSDDGAIEKAAKANPELKVETLFKVKIRGELATAYRATII